MQTFKICNEHIYLETNSNKYMCKLIFNFIHKFTESLSKVVDVYVDLKWRKEIFFSLQFSSSYLIIIVSSTSMLTILSA